VLYNSRLNFVVDVVLCRAVFDIFPTGGDSDKSHPDSSSSSGDDRERRASLHAKLPPPPWSSQSCHSSLPPPWASHHHDDGNDPPLTSPNAHKETVGEKEATLLQSSSHNFFPPTHHHCLAGGDDRPAPTIPASAARLPAHSLQHFQPIQMDAMCSPKGIETEIIADEADYQERLITRVQSWLDSSEPSEDEHHDFEDMTHATSDPNHHDPHVEFSLNDDLDIDESHMDTYL
jgi:hypothetical protein